MSNTEMKKSSSRPPVPEQTKRILCIKSRNKCAFPGCDSTLVALPTQKSPHKIIGEICHIHSGKEKGPRARVELSDEEYNSHDNLIMLCPNHHVLVDGQHESNPAESLKEWKQSHEAKSYRVSHEDLEATSEDFYNSYFPRALVDQTIEEEVNLIRKCRFFVEFDGVGSALALSRRLSEGDLYGGTTTVKAWALTCCARILAGRERLVEAEEYLELAKSLGGDTRIAEAVIYSQRGHRDTALRVLNEVDSPDARSTALAIAGNHDGPQGALDWLESAGLSVSELSPDGKFFLSKYQLEVGRWEAARESIESLCKSDMEEVPVLHHMVAMSYLLDTVPPDYHNAVLRHVPFNPKGIPLGSGTGATEARRKAHGHFIEAAKSLRQLNLRHAASELEGYALWLELRDPEYSERGKQRLEGKFGDLEFPLHLVSLGLQYGVQMDLAEVEQEIERQAAPQGEITLDGAFACLALARMQGKPENVANYIARHYDSLAIHLDTKAIRSIQIEMFAKAGLTERARECLELLSKEGLSDVEKSRLSIVIEEGEGKDTLEDREALFNQSGSLTDLEALANELEARNEWDRLCKYAEVLYEGTHDVRDAERLASALHFAGKSAQAIELLESNVDILSQSLNLQMCYCWSLYHEGELLKAHRELAKLDVDWEDENYRTLQVNLAVALVDRDSLSVAITSGYRRAENKSAQELVRAAELSLDLNLHSAKRLLFAAAEKGNDDVDVLSHVYFLAVKAGWEVDAQIASWFHRAVELSGEDGPLWPVTPSDFLDMIPEWDRQEFSIRELLDRGETPMFFAAHLLNRSRVKLVLFPALANLAERDLRRKVGVPAFSGQRGPTQLVAGGTIGLDYTALLTLGFLGLLDKVFDAFDTVYVPHSALAWLLEESQNASFHQPSRISNARRVLDLLTAGSLEKLSHSTVEDRELSVQVGEDLALIIAEAEDVSHEDTQRLVVRPNPVPKVFSLGEEEADLTRHYTVLSSCQAVVRKLYDMGEIDESAGKNALAYLQLQEKPWPRQPEINDEAVLYLDDLAIHYFLHDGILEKLCN